MLRLGLSRPEQGGFLSPESPLLASLLRRKVECKQQSDQVAEAQEMQEELQAQVLHVSLAVWQRLHCREILMHHLGSGRCTMKERE